MSENGTSTSPPSSESGIFIIYTAATSLAMLTAYYLFYVVQKPKIFTGNPRLQAFLDKHIPSLKEKYWPSWYAWEGRLQSALALFMRLPKKLKLPYRRKILELKDGGQLAIDFLGEEDENANISPEQKLLVFVLPGLTSHSNTAYVKTLALSIVRAGAVVAILNNRGLGDVPLKTPRTYCASNDEDVREVIAHLKETFPNHKMIAIGASMGGILLGRYIINRPDEAKSNFLAAMFISICWDPMAGTASIETPIVNKYLVNYVLTRNLKKIVSRYRSILETRECFNFDKILGSKTLKEFDNNFTAPQFGYASYKEYYTATLITPHIYKFSIPVVALTAADDPMMPFSDLPFKQAVSKESNLALIVTSHGGHLGFLENQLPIQRPFHLMERVVYEFVQAIRQHPTEIEL